MLKLDAKSCLNSDSATTAFMLTFVVVQVAITTSTIPFIFSALLVSHSEPFSLLLKPFTKPKPVTLASF
jgi:hypothetical protein